MSRTRATCLRLRDMKEHIEDWLLYLRPRGHGGRGGVHLLAGGGDPGWPVYRGSCHYASVYPCCVACSAPPKRPPRQYPPFALQQAEAERWSLPPMALPASASGVVSAAVLGADRYQDRGRCCGGARRAGQAVKAEKSEAVVSHPFEQLLQRPRPGMSRFRVAGLDGLLPEADGQRVLVAEQAESDRAAG